MNPALVRNILFPLHERLRGRRTFSCFRELMESQWWTAPQLRRMQSRKLSALLDHAARNISFYHERLGGREREIRRDPWSVLSDLPVMDKSEIRRHVDALVWRRAPGGLHAAFTGGSSGETLHFYFDRRRQSYDRAARMRSHAWFEVPPGEKEIYFWGAQFEIKRQDRIRTWRDEITNERLLTAYNLSAESMKRYFQVMETYQPRSLFGYPSSLEIFCRFAVEQGWRTRRCRPKAVFVTGELCLASQRQTIEAFFRCPVANGYGSREAGFIAHECPAKSMHITAENIIVEVIDPGSESGRPLPVSDGQPGELVITHLDAYAMPFIRYRIGDLGRISLAPCPCGRAAPVLEQLIGRRADHLRKPDGSLAHGLSAIYILREMKTLQRFNIHQNASGQITVKIVPEPDFGASDVDYIRRRFRALLGNTAQVEVNTVPAIEPLPSGKYRYITSDLGPASTPIDHEVVSPSAALLLTTPS